MIFHASHIFMLVKNVWDFRIFTISVHNFHFKYDRSLRKGFINSPCLQSSNKRCTLLQSSEDWLQCIQHTEHKTSFYGKGKKYLKQGRGRKKKCEANSLCRPRAYGYLKPGCLDTTAAAWHGTTYGNYIKAM